jgi:DNA-binding NarL/FixJ family response regulator
MSAPTSTSSPTSRLRLAVVDDHAIIRGVFVTLVEDAPDLIMAWTASSIAEASEKIRWDAPDVLVMDVGLPDGNGFDFTSEVLTRLPNLPILMVSAQEDKSYPGRAAAAGARGFIPKEASLEQLIEAVNTIQQGGEWFFEEGKN